MSENEKSFIWIVSIAFLVGIMVGVMIGNLRWAG